ncbi:hypothetical protein R1sor_016065 [Riccia sorocarpa]|uniref:Sec23/sec24 transport family protein n=1 Tax=Riccia sorocarpa TaxID=122646 RepID=A0ABD3HI47_9MARC
MAVRLSIRQSPSDSELQEGCGLPWGATITPFAAVDENDHQPVHGLHAEDLPRCESCYAYINVLCEVERWSWTCALCGNLNGLSNEMADRYERRSSSYPELSSSLVDFDFDEEEDGTNSGQDFQGRPVFVAAVDLSASEDFLELVKSALLAALEAISPGSLFGLVTFSHKIGLYDIQGAVPVVKQVVIPGDLDGRLPIELDWIMPLESFLAPVENNKENIASALETLKPTSSWERATAAGQSVEGVPLGGRGFGVAMDALIKYLGAERGATFAIARVFAFLSGPPDHGAGQLDTRRYGDQYASRGEDADKALLPEQTPFYKDLAALAVQAGVCVDLFAITNEYTDLASLKFLSIESGGALFYYANPDDATLPQDLYRMLNRPYAFGCALRVRTSPEFKTARVYGHFFSDPQYENLQHIICCDQYATYALDFEFSSPQGFSRNNEAPPVIQIAFKYTVILPVEDDEKYASSGSANGSSLTRQRYMLKKRLRLRTVELGIARNIYELYESADPEVVLTMLTHKVIQASLTDGVKEGRLLLHDWLVILTAQYNEFYKLARFEQRNTFTRLDVAFSNSPQLQPLPRHVFALLRSPLLLLHEEGVHPDYRIYLQCLSSALQPSFLLRSVYPVLSSYTTPDKQAYPRHSLSRAALITSGSPIFFMDAFTTLIVYYSATADPSLPFPPPQNCQLRALINKLKQERNITPKLLMIRGGHDNTEPFERYLIEEQDVDGSPLGTGMGFVSFLDQIGRDVMKYME